MDKFKNKTVKDVDNLPQKQLRDSLLHTVAEELVEKTETFLHFADIVRQDLSWQKVKEEYVGFLPDTMWVLEGMWPTYDRDSIITRIQELLQDLGCQKISQHQICAAYGTKEVMFGLLFNSNESLKDIHPEQMGFEKNWETAAKRLFIISRIFEVIDEWPNSKHHTKQKKLELATQIVNTLKTF